VIPRNPRITFEDALPHWARNHAFAQITNAGSTSLPAVETYLNTVMRQAAQRIGASPLGTQITLFCAQEGNHYRQHRLFNKLLYAPYPQLQALEDELHADYARMLARASLKANAAYCEGFESLGIIHAEFFFERIDDLLEGADERLVRLWKWHLAEEFEHRTVCYDVLHAVGGGVLHAHPRLLPGDAAPGALRQACRGSLPRRRPYRDERRSAGAVGSAGEAVSCAFHALRTAQAAARALALLRSAPQASTPGCSRAARRARARRGNTHLGFLKIGEYGLADASMADADPFCAQAAGLLGR
jgi:Predicted metal-dependent hydrolase